MKTLLIATMLLTGINCFAVVTTIDIGPSGTKASSDMAKDSATMANYVSSISSTMSKIGQTMDSVKQLQNLKGLQKLQAAGDICTLCTQSDNTQLQAYQSSIDDDLCSQFSSAYQNLTGVQQAATSLKDIMGLLNTNPQAALMSLQQATISAQQTTNSTLAQMQLLQAQATQKQLAQEKMQQQNAQAIAQGLKNPGL